jgi:hypothetical protein
MAEREIGKLFVKRKNKKNGISLLWIFEKTCKQELPQIFEQYALRKSCFRGGFTFTSASAANEIMRNVISLDVTSMHHAFINGRYVPEHFKICKDYLLMNTIAKRIKIMIIPFPTVNKVLLFIKILCLILFVRKINLIN